MVYYSLTGHWVLVGFSNYNSVGNQAQGGDSGGLVVRVLNPGSPNPYSWTGILSGVSDHFGTPQALWTPINRAFDALGQNGYNFQMVT